MRNLSKRIEALERIVLAVRRERHKIVQRALDRLSDDELVVTLDASLNEELGRVLTEEESAALQALGAAVDRGCHGSVPQLAEPFKWELDVLEPQTVARYAIKLFERVDSRKHSDTSGAPNHRE
jgi:acyl CoA:acetate/3-ketoacid CoA transferase